MGLLSHRWRKTEQPRLPYRSPRSRKPVRDALAKAVGLSREQVAGEASSAGRRSLLAAAAGQPAQTAALKDLRTDGEPAVRPERSRRKFPERRRRRRPVKPQRRPPEILQRRRLPAKGLRSRLPGGPQRGRRPARRSCGVLRRAVRSLHQTAKKAVVLPVCRRRRGGRKQRRSGSPDAQHLDKERCFVGDRQRQQPGAPAQQRIRREFVPPPPAVELRHRRAQGVRPRTVAGKRRELHPAAFGREDAVHLGRRGAKTPFHRVPLRFNWQFLERGRFSLYMGAGGMVEKCVSARLGSETVDEPGVQWSALAAVGAQYRVGGMVGLYFEPEGSYYFTETGLRTSRTDSPLTLTLRLGVRLSF